jgi:hypothetical protein
MGFILTLLGYNAYQPFFDAEMGLACPDTKLLEAESDLLARSVEVTERMS